MALYEQANSVTAQRHRGCKEKRLSRRDSLGLLYVWNDFLNGLARAAGQSRQCDRGAHNFEKMPATHRIEPLRGQRGKLARERGLALGPVFQLCQAAPILFSALGAYP